MRQAQNTDTHALNQLGMSKIVRQSDPILLMINTFNIHLEPGCKSHGQIIHYHTAKDSPKTSDSFALFLNEFYLLSWKGISCSLTTWVVMVWHESTKTSKTWDRQWCFYQSALAVQMGHSYKMSSLPKQNDCLLPNASRSPTLYKGRVFGKYPYCWSLPGLEVDLV